MTISCPKVQETDLLESRQTCEALQIAPSTLHRWTEAGIIKASVRRSNGRRVWKGADIIKAWHIMN